MNTESISTDVTTSVRQIGVGIWPNFITHDLLPNLRTQIDQSTTFGIVSMPCASQKVPESGTFTATVMSSSISSPSQP
jgi:hypothetical protein